MNMDILIIGCGSMGSNHVRVLNELKEIENIFVFDTERNIQKTVGELEKVSVFNSFEQALNSKPDGVVVATPTNTHYSIAEKIINAEIPLLIEKPITKTVAEGLELVKKAELKKIPLLVGHIERFNPAVQELKKNCDALGKLVYCSAHRFGIPTSKDIGPAVLDQGVHDIDVISFLLNTSPSTVLAMQRKILDKNSADVFSGIFNYDNLIASIEVNRVSPIKIRELILVGLEGIAKLDYVTQDLTLFIGDHAKKTYGSFDKTAPQIGIVSTIKPSFIKREPLQGELIHFINCIKNSELPLVSGRDAVAAVAAVQASIISCETGKTELIQIP